MSQFFTTISGGNLPPQIPTEFDTDLEDTTTSALTASTGTAVPQSNALRIGGDNGIKTYAITQQPGAMTIGFIRGTGTTTDVQTTTIITQAVPSNSTMTIQVIAAGFADNNEAAGMYGTAVVKNVAGTVSVVSTNPNGIDLIKNTEATLAATDLSVTASGSNFIVSATGVLGRTISWDIVLPGIVAST